MSKTVWVIEQGNYSDYRVVGVYDDEAKARRVAEAINSGETFYSDATVSEWPMNPGFDAINQGRRQYIVLMRADGHVERVTRREDISPYEMVDVHQIWRRSKAPAYAGKPDKPDVLNSTVWATSDEHAVKIVNEQRMQMLASRQWAA